MFLDQIQFKKEVVSILELIYLRVFHLISFSMGLAIING